MPRVRNSLHHVAASQSGHSIWPAQPLHGHNVTLLFVQVCMVAVCTYQKDVVHAGYLAIALLFFRQRSQLMVPGNRLFPWLPAFNFLVMLLMVAYQVGYMCEQGASQQLECSRTTARSGCRSIRRCSTCVINVVFCTSDCLPACSYTVALHTYYVIAPPGVAVTTLMVHCC